MKIRIKAYFRAFVRYVFVVDDVTSRMGMTVCRDSEGEYRCAAVSSHVRP